jgi:DNA-damage-inducible protein D
MSQIPHTSPFDGFRHEDEHGKEFWSARELGKLLGYGEYRKFKNAIEKAEEACQNSGQAVADHFVHVGGMIEVGKGARRKVEDVHLTRYACYLLVENADPSKPIVALGQAYFAVQTRRQEINDELALANLPEDQKRLIFRSLMPTYNARLAEAVKQAGVIEPRDFATFQDHGYMGLYDGMRENDIHARKGLKPEEKILDYMVSEELAANMFRATQANAKLQRDQVSNYRYWMNQVKSHNNVYDAVAIEKDVRPSSRLRYMAPRAAAPIWCLAFFLLCCTSTFSCCV